MTRDELITKLKTNFKIQELVCRHCYERFGDNAWQFLSTELLSTLYILRYKVFNKPMIINDWAMGGKLSQRGLRCNMCPIVKNKNRIYLSAHILGKAIDFNISGLSTKQIYDQIRKNIDLFEYPIRIEANSTSWNHVDVYQYYNNNKKLVEFRV